MASFAFGKAALAVYGIGIALTLVFLFKVWNFDGDLFLASLRSWQVVEEVNGERAEMGRDLLRTSAALQQAAQLKAEDMVSRGYFSHEGPEGQEPWVWLEQVEYPFATAAENLAIDVADARALAQAWLASPGHAKNLYNPHFREIGIGIAEGKIEGRETRVVVAFFAQPIEVKSQREERKALEDLLRRLNQELRKLLSW